MKQGHCLAVYLLLYLICFVHLFLEQNHYEQTVQEKQRVEWCLQKSLDDAAEQYTGVLFESEEDRKRVLLEAFFDSFYVYFGVHDSLTEQRTLQLYIPMIVLAEEDGVTFYHAEEKEIDGIRVIEHGWSEKRAYSLNEGVLTKTVVGDCIEQYASSIISNHNYIAQQYGLDYNFFVPQFLQNTATKIEFPMVFVVFQGWPLTASGSVTYDNCLDAGASIRATEKYMVEVPVNLTKTYSCFHKTDCAYMGMKGRILQGQLFSRQEAVSCYGAVPCEFCVE